MKPNTLTGLSKETQTHLESLRREFERCSNQYPALYHELWRPGGPFDYTPEDIPNFRKMCFDDYEDRWETWDGQYESYFGHFFGNGKGLKEFKALADAASIVLGQVDLDALNLGMSFFSSLKSCFVKPGLQGYSGYHRWLKFMYDVSVGFPTPLLRSVLWQFGGGDDTNEGSENTPVPDGEERLRPTESIHLSQQIFTASIATIDLILAIQKGETVVSTAHQPAPSFQSKVSDKGPVLLFELHGREWHFEFDTGYGIRKAKYYMKGKPVLGFEVCRYLLSKPNEWKDWKEICLETGQGEKVEAAPNESNQELTDEHASVNYDREQARLWRLADDEVDLRKKRAIFEQIRDIDEKKGEGRRKRLFPSYNARFADQIQSQRDLAISKIHKVLDELAVYLSSTLKRHNCGFVYARDDYLHRLLTAGLPELFID